MALINIGDERPDEDPWSSMFQNMPTSAQLPTPTPPPPEPAPRLFGTQALAPEYPTDVNGQQPPQAPQPAQPQAPPPPQASAPFSYDQINALYQQYLGRGASQDEYQGWATGAYGPPELGSIQRQIAESGEAQAYRAAHGGGGGASPTPSGGRTDQNYITSVVSQWMAQNNPQGHQDPSYWVGRILATGGLGADNMAYWQGRFTEAPGTHIEGPAPSGGGGGGYAGTNVFSDPATAQFESLLNSLITRFNTPQTPPHYQQTIDQLNAYLAQLNGPVYTPAQMELMQTQAWDPMQQQKDAAKQRLIQRLGAQGISPSSGIFESALADLDRQFQQAHTQTQANFSNQAIGLQRQNQATAATLAPQISNFEQAQTSWQDQRALQGEMLAALIPQMASQRLRDASGSIQQLNPMSLLQMLQGFQNQGYGQDANYGNYIMQLLAQLFGVGGQ